MCCLYVYIKKILDVIKKILVFTSKVLKNLFKFVFNISKASVQQKEQKLQ